MEEENIKSKKKGTKPEHEELKVDKKVTKPRKSTKPKERNDESKIENKKKKTDKKVEIKEELVDSVKEIKPEPVVLPVKKINPPFRTSEVIFLLIVTFLVTLGMGYIIFNDSNKQEPEKKNDSIQSFLEEYNYIVDNYYGEIDQEELLKTALESIINSLDDPYSTFMDDLSNSAIISLEGSFEGIGVEIINDLDNNIVVIRVLEDSPAEKAGIKALDVIKKIDNTKLENTSTSDFVEKVAKKKDASFDLTILRDKKEMVVKVSRKLITIQSVKSEIIEKNNQKIGYLNVNVFAANTFHQFKRELTKLEEQNIDSLIIDLRDNGGGHLSVVSNMISLFLDSSHVIYQTETKTENEKFYSTGNVTKDYPIVLLSNRNSASASEVMMGALRDEYNATIVGEVSFGKGTVQQVLTLPSKEQYKLTTKKWLTPKGDWVNGVGIKPDIEIKLSEEYLKKPSKETDNQLQEALKYLTK